MNRATPQMRSIAKHLMVTETRRNRYAEAPAAAALPVTDRLRPYLATLVGKGGVRALVARALVLATAEVAWLRAARVNADGDLEGFDALGANLDPAEIMEGRVVLLAQLLGLLVAFVGPSLTSRLVGEIWPEVPLNARNFGKEHGREEAK